MLKLNRVFPIKKPKIFLDCQWIANVKVSDAILTPYVQGEDYSWELGLIAWIEGGRFTIPTEALLLKYQSGDNTEILEKYIYFDETGRLQIDNSWQVLSLFPETNIVYIEGIDYVVNYDKGIIDLPKSTRLLIGFSNILIEFETGLRINSSCHSYRLAKSDIEQPKNNRIGTPLINLIEGTYSESDYTVDYVIGKIEPINNLLGKAGIVSVFDYDENLVFSQLFLFDKPMFLPQEVLPVNRIEINVSPRQLIEWVDYVVNYANGAISFLPNQVPERGTFNIEYSLLSDSAYASPGDFIELYERQEAVEISNLSIPNAVNPDYGKMWKGLEYATGEINMYLGNHSVIPLSPVPSGIEWKCLVLCRAYLDNTKIREGVQRDLDIVLNQLKDIRDGKIKPINDSGDNSGGSVNFSRGINKLNHASLVGW
jgi:phage gp36-like protein